MKRYATCPTNAGAALGLLLAALLFASCDQSAIFNSISNETEKASAKIEGSPTRIVKVGSSLFIANGYLWTRDASDGSGAWEKASRPTDSGKELKIRDLAAIGTKLYAYTVADTNTVNTDTFSKKVWASENGTGPWAELENSSGYEIYALYAANGELFAGARKKVGGSVQTYESEYAILHLVGAAFQVLADGLGDGGKLIGAVHDGSGYYLATTNLGIYSTSDLSAAPTIVSSTSGYSLVGIAAVGQGAAKAVVAVGGYPDGNVILLQKAGIPGFLSTGFSSTYFTGAIAEYDTGTSEAADGTPDYLLIGYKYGTTYGYREIELSGGELTGVSSLGKPSADSTVSDYDQYAGALGVVPVAHLYQSWEVGVNILYASSNIQGLWATVDRGNWNLVSR